MEADTPAATAAEAAAPAADNNSDKSIDVNLRCEVCDSPDDWSKMLLCDKCADGYHTYCLGIDDVPNGRWYCDKCLSQERQQQRHQQVPAIKQEPKQQQSDTPSYELTTQDGNSSASSEDEEEESSEDAETPLGIQDIWEEKATLYFIKTGSHNTDLLPEESTALVKKEIKRIERRAKNYRWDIKSSQLLKQPSTKYPLERIVPPPEDRLRIIEETHLDTGHLSSTRLAAVIARKWYFPGLTKLVKQKVQSCLDCLRNRALFKQQPELKPLPPAQLWERIHLDSMGGYQRTRNNNTHIMVAVDAASKYIMARAVKRCTAAEMCSFFMEEVVAHWGCPQIVCSDSGPEFGRPWPQLLESLGIKDVRSSAYHPQSNGQAEAAVRVLLTALQRSVADAPETWDEKLPMVLLGLRTAPSSSSKMSPAFICRGWHPKLPAMARRHLGQPTANHCSLYLSCCN
jgi:hypothetical protein